MKKTFERGNVAIAKAAVAAGCRYYFGYPITPQNEIPEYLSRVLPSAGGQFVQAESEIGLDQHAARHRRHRQAVHDQFVEPWDQPDAGGHQLPRRERGRRR